MFRFPFCQKQMSLYSSSRHLWQQNSQVSLPLWPKNTRTGFNQFKQVLLSSKEKRDPFWSSLFKIQITKSTEVNDRQYTFFCFNRIQKKFFAPLFLVARAASHFPAIRHLSRAKKLFSIGNDFSGFELSGKFKYF